MQKVLERVKLKASTYGQDIVNAATAPASTPKPEHLKVDPQLISDLYRDFVMPLTKEVQVAYLLQRISHPAISVAGVEGSFCWLAAQAHFGGEHLTNDFFLTSESISKVFNDVSANRTAYGVVPIEDSKLGMVKETQAQLLRSSLKVSAEVIMKRSFVFAASDKDAVKRAEVTKVFTAAGTESQLLGHVEQTWPTALIVTVSNVSEAAANAAKEPNSVAVTTSGAAIAHGLQQLEHGNALASAMLNPWPSSTSSGGESSFIRFAVISKGCPEATGDDKSCWSMEITHEVGSLLGALEVWKQHGVNLTCIESIYRQEQGGYDFFVETVGHCADANVRAAVEQLQAGVCTVQHLGSFPVAKRQVAS